jgi:hypothetical protein
LSAPTNGNQGDFVERPRQKKSQPKAKFDFMDILSGNLKVTLELSEVDRDAIKQIGDKVDYRWKWTQKIMVTAIVLSIIGQVITWTL